MTDLYRQLLSPRFAGWVIRLWHRCLALEVEGAAVAQVCLDYGVPFGAVRTISDRADDTAHIDFSLFIREVASPYAMAILDEFFKNYPLTQ